MMLSLSVCGVSAVLSAPASATSVTASASNASGRSCTFTAYATPGAYTVAGLPSGGLVRQIPYGTTLDCNGVIGSSLGFGAGKNTETGIRTFDPVAGGFGDQGEWQSCTVPSAGASSCNSGQGTLPARHYTPNGNGINWRYSVSSSVYIRSQFDWNSYPQGNGTTSWRCTPIADSVTPTNGILSCHIGWSATY